MFINTGLLRAVDNEAELAGAMGHEMSHVILRHGTNQASKDNLIELPAMLGSKMTGSSRIEQLAQLGIGSGSEQCTAEVLPNRRMPGRSHGLASDGRSRLRSDRDGSLLRKAFGTRGTKRSAVFIRPSKSGKSQSSDPGRSAANARATIWISNRKVRSDEAGGVED